MAFTALDHEQLSERFFSDGELIQEIATLSVAEIDRLGAELADAVAADDRSRLSRVAHELRGVLCNVAARPASELAHAVIETASARSSGEVAPLVGALRAESDRVVVELRQLGLGRVG